MNFKEQVKLYTQIIHPGKRWGDLSLQERKTIHVIAREESEEPSFVREVEEISWRYLGKNHLTASTYRNGVVFQNFEFGIPKRVGKAYLTLNRRGYKPTKRIHQDEIVLYLTFELFWRNKDPVFYQLGKEDMDTFFKVAYDIHSKLGDNDKLSIWYADKMFPYTVINAERFFYCIKPSLLFFFAPPDVPAERIKEIYGIFYEKLGETLPLSLNEEEIDFLRSSVEFNRWAIEWLFEHGFSTVKKWSYLATTIYSLRNASLWKLFLGKENRRHNYEVERLIESPILTKDIKTLTEIAAIWSVPKSTFIDRINEIHAMIREHGDKIGALLPKINEIILEESSDFFD